ncbi:MAG: histidine kinase [Cyclobacteriaceae bacterium]
MKNPILSGSGYKYYLLVWVILASAHLSILFFYYHFSLPIAITEAIIYHVVFAAIVPSFWYIVQFASASKDGLSLISTHTVAAAVTIAFWISISGLLLKGIHKEEQEYLVFFEDAFIWRIIIGSMYYSISILIFYLIKYYLDMQEEASRALELQALLKDSELRMLKSQINPHFIFNSLNSISALTITEPKSAQKMVIKLSDFLRYSLGKDSIQMNSLKDEIENLSHYMDIEKVRFGEKLIFTKNIGADCEKVLVPNLILQPLFENAIKYSVYESTDKESVDLRCEVKNGILDLSLNNSFPADSFTRKGEGIGLENVRKRLELVYGNQAQMTISKTENTFSVNLKFPLKMKAK